MKITKVVFIEPQPAPNGIGPVRTTFETKDGWALSRDGDYIAVGNREDLTTMYVPYSRVLRLWCDK